jgi:SNF2 family DNA or RNA helicase
VLVVTGDTPPDERLRMRREFGSASGRRIIMLAQARTMSIAVNELVSSSHAVFGSLSERRDDYVQARDRLNRIGQKLPVTFWHVLGRGTVDEVMLGAHRTGTSLEEAVLRHVLSLEGLSGEATDMG